MKLFEPRRQHPVLVVFQVVKLIRQVMVPLGIFLVSTVFDENPVSLLWALGLGLLGLLLLVVFPVLSWLRFTYRVQEEQLVTESGVLFRQKRFVPKKKIQSINVTEGLLHRIFGLAKVEIETAGGAKKAEATLEAVTKEEAVELRRMLTEPSDLRPMGEASAESAEEQVRVADENPDTSSTYTLSFKELLIVGTTSGNVWVVFAIIAAVVPEVADLFPRWGILHLLMDYFKENWQMLFVIIPVVFLLSWMVSVVMAMFKYANFKLVRVDDKIFITRGLIEKQAVTIPLQRMQAVRIVEGVVQQPFGLTSLMIDSAGFGNQKGESTVFHPLMRRDQVLAFLQDITPEFAVDVPVQPVKRQALGRYVFRVTWMALLVTAALALLIPGGYGVWTLALVPLFVLYGWMSHRDAGYANVDNTLLFRFRHLSRITSIVPRRRLQSAFSKQSWLQKRGGLATFGASVVSGSGGVSYRVVDVEEQVSEQLLNWSLGIDSEEE